MKKFLFITKTFILATFLGCAFTAKAQTVTISYHNDLSNPGQTNASGHESNVNDVTLYPFIPSWATTIEGKVWGGGGGGGAGTWSYSGGGGGGGGYTYRNFGTVGQGQTATVQIGKCGKRGEIDPSRTNAQNGGDSKIDLGGFNLLAKGGTGGNSGYSFSYGSGGSGGTASGGTTNTTGTAGGKGASGTSGKGGGTVGAGDVNGVNGTSNRGKNGNNPGGGASGSWGSGSGLPGAVGAGGRVIISFTFNPSAPAISGTNNYCEGNTISLSVNNPCNDGGVTYTWYKNGTSTNVTGATFTKTNAQTGDNGNYTVVATYSYSYAGATSVTGTNVSGTTLSGTLPTSNSITVTVYQIPAVTNSPLTETVCSSETRSVVTLYSNVADATFNWTATASGSITGLNTTSGTGNLPNETFTNTGATAGTVTYSITPTANGCTGTTVNYVVTVNSKPDIADKTIIICSEETFTVNLNSDIVLANTTYTWNVAPNANVTGQSVQSTPTSAIVSQTLTNTIDIPQQVVYMVTPSANGCAGNSFLVTVTVNPKPAPIGNYEQTICAGEDIDYQPSEDLTYSYKDVVDAASVSLTNLTASESFFVTAKNSYGCTGEPFLVDITVNQPTASELYVEICEGETYYNKGFMFSETSTQIFTIKNVADCDSTITLHLTVTPPPSKTNETPSAVCSGEKVPFTPDADVTYTFKVNGVDFDINSEILNFNDTDSVFEINVTQENTILGCVGDPFTITATIKPEPQNDREVNGLSVVPNIEAGTAVVSWTEDAEALSYTVNVYVNEEETPFDTQVVTEGNLTLSSLNFEGYSHRIEVIAQYECNEVSQPATVSIAQGGNATHFEDILFSKANIWTSNGTLYVTNNNIENGIVTIFNLVGKPIATLKILSGETRSIALPQSIYLLKAGNKAVKIVL